MHREAAILIAGLFLISILGAAPYPRDEQLLDNGVWGAGMVYTDGDEFGSLLRDLDGRPILNDGDKYVYGVLNKDGTALVPSTFSFPVGDPPNTAGLKDPVTEEEWQAFNLGAGTINPVIGDIALTIIPIEIAAWVPEGQENGGYWVNCFDSLTYFTPTDTLELYNYIFDPNFSINFPEASSMQDQDIDFSIAEFWNWSSNGRSSIVPDTERCDWYRPGFPGWMGDPSRNNAPWVIHDTYFPTVGDIANLVTAAGGDLSFSSNRPIIFLTNYPSSVNHGFYSGFITSTLWGLDYDPESNEGLDMISTGVLIHELGHAVLQLPDLYTISTSTHWQIMNYGCLGYTNNSPFSPADYSMTFKLLLGWADPIPMQYATAIEFPFSNPRMAAVSTNPEDPSEFIVVSGYDPINGPAFLNYPVLEETDEGNLLIEHAYKSNYEWIYLFDQHASDLIFSPGPIEDESRAVWSGADPTLDQSMVTWVNTDQPFPYQFDFTSVEGDPLTSTVTLSIAPVEGLATTMFYNPIMSEIELGNSQDVSISVENIGTQITSLELDIESPYFHHEGSPQTVDLLAGESGTILVPQSAFTHDFDQTLLAQQNQIEFTLSLNNGSAIETRSSKQTVVLPRNNLDMVSFSHESLFASYEKYLAIFDPQNDKLCLFNNGVLQWQTTEFNDIDYMTFADFASFDPFPGQELIISGGGVLTVLKTGTSMYPVQLPGWPLGNANFGPFLVTELPSLGGPCLCSVIEDELWIFDHQANLARTIPIPNMDPIRQIAFADDVINAEKFFFIGGEFSHIIKMISISGELLFEYSSDGTVSYSDPICGDFINNGYADVLLRAKTVDGNQWQDKMIICTYSTEFGHYSTGLLSFISDFYDTQYEEIVPVNLRREDRVGIAVNHFRTLGGGDDPEGRLEIYDLAVYPPALLEIPMENRRRILMSTKIDSDDDEDLILFERGRGTAFYRGSQESQGMAYAPWSGYDETTPLATVHVDDLSQWHPIPWMINDILHLGYRVEDENSYTLEFFSTGGSSWPTWSDATGRSNTRFFQSADGYVSSNILILTAPILECKIGENGGIDLWITSVEGQQCTELEIYKNESLVDTIPWNGLSPVSWTDSNVEDSGHSTYHVVVKKEVLDGSLFWD